MVRAGLRCLFWPFVSALVLCAAPWEGRVVPFRQMELPAPVTGRIEELLVQEGDAVKAGQVLGKLFSRMEALDVARCQAMLKRKDFEAGSANQLVNNKVIARSSAVTQNTELELAQIALEMAKVQLEQRSFLSPMDAIVVERLKDVGEALVQGQTVFKLADLSKVLVIAHIKPEELPLFEKGKTYRVRFPQLANGPVLKGSCVFVSPVVGDNGLIPVRLLVNNEGMRIKPGLKAVFESES